MDLMAVLWMAVAFLAALMINSYTGISRVLVG